MEGIKEKEGKLYKIGVIGSEILGMGFKLAGVKAVRIARDGEEAEKALDELLNMQDIGIIIIAEGLAKKIKSKRLKHIIETSLMPLIIAVPDYQEKEEEVDTLRRLVLRAIGIDILAR
ncbi:MAG: V-type ATP synthase subunit F [Candidatus Micrarchaeota archaeon]